MKRTMLKIMTMGFALALLGPISSRADWYQRNDKWRYSQNGRDLSNIWIYDKDYMFYELNANGDYTNNTKEFITATDGLDIDQLRKAYHSYKDLAGVDNENLLFALNLINNERAKVGVAPLKLSVERSILGTYINENMYKNSYFSHYYSSSATAEYILVGKKMFPNFDGIQGENIYYSSVTAGKLKPMKALIEEAQTWYVKSAGHYNNIVDPDYKKVGIGFTVKKEGNREVFYYSQEFSE